jgi:RNA polymerase sigma-70 factor (ECF subfamily)
MAHRRISTAAELHHLATLLEQVGRGDARAFAALHALTCRKLRRTAASVCPLSSDVEDVLQDSYLKIWRAASSFDPGRASPISWMCTIVKNTALDSNRAKKMLLAGLEDAMAIPAPGADPDEFDYEFAKQITVEALSGLPEDRRRLLSLAYFEGMSRHSLAEQFGVPVGTVKTWLRRAVESIRADCLVTVKAMSLQHSTAH